MKTVILAGGKGTRIGQRTSTIPKPMLPIGSKPILWHIMKIYSYFGFNEFVICLGYKSDVIKNFFYFYDLLNFDFTIDIEKKDITYHNFDEKLNWKVTLAETGIETLKGGRIKRIEKYLDDDINFLTYGDGLADINIPDLLQFHKKTGKILTLTGVHPPSRFGEIVEKDNTLQFFVEKPQTSASLINGGFMVFNKTMMDYLTEAEDCDFERGPLLQLVEENEVAVYKHKGNWDCLDTERDFQYLNNLWNQNKAFWKIWEK
ncbi:MAG: glucose-1-phosphate cytidylyltransferase [Candidatus Helarchaeota archaeon]